MKVHTPSQVYLRSQKPQVVTIFLTGLTGKPARPPPLALCQVGQELPTEMLLQSAGLAWVHESQKLLQNFLMCEWLVSLIPTGVSVCTPLCTYMDGELFPLSHTITYLKDNISAPQSHRKQNNSKMKGIRRNPYEDSSKCNYIISDHHKYIQIKKGLPLQLQF